MVLCAITIEKKSCCCISSSVEERLRTVLPRLRRTYSWGNYIWIQNDCLPIKPSRITISEATIWLNSWLPQRAPPSAYP
uniref:Uncharacterized protein n=1 Tax=Lepeophtheirus salmonis TaxID=72036 RepID=A0A0K2U5U3_LEPSM